MAAQVYAVSHVRLAAIVGVVLIVVGLYSLAYGSFTYTRREKVLDLGPVEATAERHERIPLPPALGVVSLLAGVGLIAVAARRK